ncbi:MAG: hypothetical protein CMJ48_04030 [Planctomycetaceae bacterium]|nr:hypothetical protein [Planctomycetaceae bacterium]
MIQSARSLSVARWRRFLALALLGMLAVAFSPRLLAQDEEETDPVEKQKTEAPLVIVNVAGVERILQDVDYTFASVDRDDVTTILNNLIENVANNLEGIDRKKPLGLMIYLSDAFPPTPVVVAYVPVSEMSDLEKTLAKINGTLAPVDGQESLYKLSGVGRGESYALHQGGYLFITENEEELDRKFADPEKVAATLTGRYDVAASLNLKSVPEAAKTAFLFYLRASAEAELQQRDDEPAAQYEMRKSSGQRTLELLEQLLTQGEQITIGADFSTTNKQIRIELAVDAKSESKFAEYLTDIGGKRSYFARMLDGKAPLTVSSSWNLDKAGREILASVLKVGEGDVGAQLASDGDAETPAAGVFESLKATAKNGHVDLFIQMLGEPPQKFVLVGGVRVEKDAQMAASMAKILERVRDKEGGGIAELELNVDSHNDVAIHRVRGSGTSRSDERLYGKERALYVGAGNKAIWFAVGGDEALPALKAAMDKVLEPRRPGENKDPDTPLQVIMNMGTWIAMSAGDEGGGGRFREVASDAFAKGGQTLRVEVKPTESGARMRVTFEEGFIRLIGLSISRQMDRSNQL